MRHRYLVPVSHLCKTPEDETLVPGTDVSFLDNLAGGIRKDCVCSRQKASNWGFVSG